MNGLTVCQTKALPSACGRPRGWWGVIVSVMILCSLMMGSLPRSSSAATYYLKPDTGLDSNNGTFAAPWKTMLRVRNSGASPAVVAGDTINVIGGTYTSTQYKGESASTIPLWTQSNPLGTSNNPIIIQANPGDTVVFDGEFNAGVYWMLFRASASYGGHYIIVRNLTFHHFKGAAIGFGINGVVQSHHFAVVNCIFQNFTSNQAGAISHNTADNAIYRNNRILNIGDPSLGGDGIPDGQHGFYISHDSHNIVFDQNYLETISGFGVHGYGGFTGAGSANWIVRKNTIVNTWQGTLTYAADTHSNIYTYHNTFYNNTNPFPALGNNPNCLSTPNHCSMVTTHGGGSFSNMVLQNNIGLGYETQAAVWVDSVTPYIFSPMDYNLWYNQLTTTSVYKWNNTLYDLPGFKTATPGTQEDHAINNFPAFTDVPARNFTLTSGSPARNSGTPLTTAVGAGTSATALTVVDSKYFTDGYGISTSILPGDTIQVGSVTTTITGISGNVLTISPAISWLNGAAVSLPWYGTAPDMGALEFVETPRPTVYYLKPDSGLDTNNGSTPSTPWKTMDKAKVSLQAGDTLNVLQGTYTQPQYQIAPTPVWDQTMSLGAPDTPIIIQAAPGAAPVFDGLYDASWMTFAASASYGGHYIVVKGLTFQHFNGSALIFAGSSASTPVHHVGVVNNTFKDFISNFGGPVKTINTHHLLVQGNRFTNIGDNTLGGDASPEWQQALYLQDNTSNLVVDGNYIEKISGYGLGAYGRFTAGSVSSNWIVRKNTIVNTFTGGLWLAGDSFTNTYLYHNTFYNEQVPFASRGSTSHAAFLTTQPYGGVAYTNLVVLNNIGLGYEVQAPTWTEAVTLPWGTMDYNLWVNQLTPTSVYRWNGVNYTLAGFQTATPGTQEDHSLNTSPLFLDAPGRNFGLQVTSPAKNTAAFLTTTTNSGSSSTALTVGDTNFFFDGYHLGAGLSGDTIRIGAQLVQIASVNSATSLTLTAPATWASGAAVSLPYNDTNPDMGALEYVPVLPATIGGVELDGVDDYVTVGTSAAYQCANATCTLMGWFRSSGGGANSGAGYLFAKRSLGGDVGGYFLRVDAAGTLTGRTYDSAGGPNTNKSTAATTAKDGNWHCFAMVFTTNTAAFAGNNLTLYYDGVLDTVNNGTGSTAYDTTTNPLVFGALSDFDSSGWLNGNLDDVRFYPSGLSAENIARYCSARVKFGGYGFGTLLSYWPFNQCAEGASGDTLAFPDVNKGGSAATGVDGANNTGVTCHGTNRMSYPASVE
ncbi:MAG TPA: hypothetical protein VF077_12480 [Nitrospiraceae bacterium]